MEAIGPHEISKGRALRWKFTTSLLADYTCVIERKIKDYRAVHFAEDNYYRSILHKFIMKSKGSFFALRLRRDMEEKKKIWYNNRKAVIIPEGWPHAEDGGDAKLYHRLAPMV